MDMFIEKMVARKRRGKDFLIAVAATLVTTLLSFLIIGLFFGLLFGLELLIIVGLFFICYRIIAMQNVEFEYSLTNNELDIDKIIAQRRRKRIVTVNARSIDIFAPITNAQYEHEKNSSSLTKTYDCSSGAGGSSTYFVVFFDGNGQKSMLLFEPNQKMIDGFKKYNKAKVFEV